MIDIDKVMKEINDTDGSFRGYVERSYSDFIITSDLPSIYREHNIDETKLSARLKILKENFFKMVTERDNYVFNVASYNDIGRFVSLLLDNYYLNTLKLDAAIEQILYVDTNLVLEDLKKMMDASDEENAFSLAHGIETITRNIENAACVIWNRFSMINSAYDRQKLYNILLTRQRRNLSNIFFIKNSTHILASVVDTDLYEIMNIREIVDLSKQQIKFKNLPKKEDIKW